MTAIIHASRSDVKDKERKANQWFLGVCRIRRKGIGPRSDATRGSGFLVKDLIITDPASKCNTKYLYCLITASQAIYAKDSLENYYLEFRKLHSKKLKTVPLHEIANLQEVLRTRNTVFIRLNPPSKSYENKESIFTYRPFKVTNVNQIASKDFLCVFVEDKDMSFDVIDLEIQRRIEQNSPTIHYQVMDDQKVSTTYKELTLNKNRMPYGGVILMRQENLDEKFLAAGCLDFADDKSICPVLFPLIPTDTCQGGPQSTNATFSGEGGLTVGAGAVDAVAATSSGSVSGGGATVDDDAGDTSSGSITDGSAAAVDAVAASSGNISGGGVTVNDDAGDTSSGSITGGGGGAIDAVAASSGSVSGGGATVDDDAGDTSSGSMTGSGGAAVDAVVTSSGSVSGGGATVTVDGDVGDTSSGSVTGGAAAVDAAATSSSRSVSVGGATVDEGELTSAHGNFLVSEKLVLPECKNLYEKLVRALDNPANRCIANWEHLACTQEVKAPLLVRLKCKLSTNYSHTQILLEVLAVRENEEVVTVTKLIAALKAIGRNDIVKMIKDVHCEAESSPQPLKDFKDCDSNNDLLEQIITKLDDQTQVPKHWRHLGQELKVSKKKLDMIEFCAPFNPTKSLMEYLLAEQNVTVKNFKEKVQQRTVLLAAFKALEPFLNMGCNQDKLMKDVIDLDNEYMDAFYVCLNKIIPGVDNWRQLATAFGIPRDIYKDFDPKEPTSPTKQLFEWLFADRTELTLDQLCSALKCIKRNDLVGDVRKCFEQC